MAYTSNHVGKRTIAVVRLPEEGSFSRADLHILASDFETAERDPAVGVILLRGAESGFCLGLDLAEFDDAEGLDDLAAALCRCFLALARLRKPLVISVNGLACGFGATMLCHADVVVASERTRICMPFLDLGLIPEAGSTLLLAERIGYLNAVRLLCLTEEIGAIEGQRMGLITYVEAVGAVETRAMETALCLARHSPELLAGTQRLMRLDRPALVDRIHLEVQMCLERLRDPLVRRRLSHLARRSRHPPRKSAA